MLDQEEGQQLAPGAHSPGGVPGGAPVPPPEWCSVVDARRASAGLDPREDPLHWGLALSGGGIRSATFCFGLVRALAANAVFRRFDYLSTVSGGGYLGSAIGRLFDGSHSAAQVEAGLARNDSLLLWWLRNNGRYLTPAGVRDLAQAFATISRGVLSTHFEVGVLLFLGAALMVLPTLALQSGIAPDELHRHLGSAWFVAAGLPLALAFHNIFAYWFVRRQRSRASQAMSLLIGSGCAAAAALWGWQQVHGHAADGARFAWPSVLAAWACLLLFTPFTGALCRSLRATPDVSAARLAHTKRQAFWVSVTLGMVAVGAMDWLSWVLGQWVVQRHGWPWTAAIAALPAPIVALARPLMPRLKKWLAQQKDLAKDPVKTRRALNAAGIVLLVLIALAWATAFQYLLASLPWTWLEAMLAAHPVAMDVTWGKWIILAALPAAYVLFTRNDLEVLNLSSMHNFYRARIERAYVSCGNKARFGAGTLVRATRTAISQARRLVEAVPGDDTPLAAYTPHRHGGPIHLVNCCINQTVDDRTRNYNADRKGVALTVSSFGAETGTHLPLQAPPVPGTLSTWAAISGAAASSGMGSETSPGLAALLFLSGARLGYWHESLLPKASHLRWVSRPELVRDEALARFPGLHSARWYLSDGGHFDNTGVYALLKRQVGLIVLADCGADPEYRFADVENLVRKARIDYGADIAFLQPAPALAATPALQQLQACIGTPATIAAAPGAAFLLLGRITYIDGTKGALVVVKPRCDPGMPMDIGGYAQRNARFPQQTTGDQFFDEEQWEAYHQLGVRLGSVLSKANLDALAAWV